MPSRCSPIVLCASILALLTLASEARSEWNYRDGYGYESRRGELRLNFFVRPRFEYSSNDGTGATRNSFRLDLAGGRLRIWTGRRQVFAEIAGGISGDEGILLDAYLEFRSNEYFAIRLGYFRVPFDEQTTHAPFWLRMTDKSIAVRALGYDYDLGLAIRGSFLDDSLVYAVSITNGEPLVWENLNIDFLYSARVALSIGRLDGWYDNDLIIGIGTSWNLEPWSPEESVTVNRSVLAETLDITLRLGDVAMTLAGLYRYIDPGAYGSVMHVVGWHFEGGVFMGDHLEIAARVAHLVPIDGAIEMVDQGFQLWPDGTGGGGSDGGDDQQIWSAAMTLNAFVHDNRIRVQLEYSYLVALRSGEIDLDSHRVVAQVLALY